MLSWTEKWPTKPGYYWFFGKIEKDSIKDDLYLVTVGRSYDGFTTYIVRGFAIMKSLTGEGVWQPVILPTLPD